jgi:hypothetical protein
MDINYGSGRISVILDLRNGWLHIYGSSHDDDIAGLHRRLGGKTYYRSRSGYSGAGWLPNAPYLAAVGTIRRDATDWYSPGLPVHDDPKKLGTVAGWRVWVPYRYKPGSSSLDYDRPTIMIREDDDHRVVFCPDNAIYQVLCRGREYLKTQTTMPPLEGSYWVSPGVERTAQNETEYQVSVIGQWRPAHLRAAMEEIAGLMFNFDDGGVTSSSTDEHFWSRLGLVAGEDGYRYQVRRRRCRHRVLEYDLNTVEALQAVSPQNVMVLRPQLYIQGDLNVGVTAVCRHQMSDGSWYDFESPITGSYALRVISGDIEAIDELADLLVTGAEGKFHEDQVQRTTEALRTTDLVEFEERCKQHGSVTLTFADSLAAGNCEPGTTLFRDRYFQGRGVASVAELVPYLHIDGVRRAIVHRLDQLS